MNQKGFAAQIVLIAVLVTGLAFYLGFKVRDFNFFPALNSSKTVESLPQENKLSYTPTPTTTIVKVPTATPSAKPFDYKGYFKDMFPKDIPVYPGAKMIDSVNQGSCKADLLKNNKDCLQVMFIFGVTAEGNSVERVVNWYVTNPAPGWTYRGVYGDQRDYQFGDIYKDNVYYRLIYRYPAADKTEIEIDYNGPYPISDLSPKP